MHNFWSYFNKNECVAVQGMSFTRWKVNHSSNKSNHFCAGNSGQNNGKDFNRRLNKSYAPCVAPFYPQVALSFHVCALRDIELSV